MPECAPDSVKTGQKSNKLLWLVIQRKNFILKSRNLSQRAHYPNEKNHNKNGFCFAYSANNYKTRWFDENNEPMFLNFLTNQIP